MTFRIANKPPWPLACLVIPLISLLCLAPLAAGRQARIDWLREHAVAIETAAPDPASDTANDADFQPLIDLIGDARVVQLGEQTHGDGTAFLLRARLVRFLHERMGFDVLAFESGFYESRAVRAALADPEIKLREAILAGVYDVWAGSRQIDPLFRYLRRSLALEDPLRFTGFDVQFSRPGTGERLTDDLVGLFGRTDGTALTARQRERLEGIARAVQAQGRYAIEPDEHEANVRLLDDLMHRLRDDRSPLRQHLGDHELAWWGRVMAGLAHMERNTFLESGAPPISLANMDEAIRAPHRILAAIERDRGMVENLLWLLSDSSPGGRMIVWAANSHVAHQSTRRASGPMPGEVETPIYIPAGQRLREALGDDVYTILTVPFRGRWAAPSIRTAEGELRWQEGEYEPAADGSLADLLHEAGFDFAILDLRPVRDQRDHWLNQPLLVRQDMFGGTPVILADFCDAVLFIDEMAPSTPRADSE